MIGLQDGKNAFFLRIAVFLVNLFKVRIMRLWKVAVLATKPKKSISELLGGKERKLCRKTVLLHGNML